MNRFIPVLAVALLGFTIIPATSDAAEAVLSRDDCQRVVEQWAAAEEPAATPAVLDTCKQRLADTGEEAEAERLAAFPQSALNPCAEPGASDSVLCWGPWAALAPAAGPPLPRAVASTRPPTEVSCRPELAEQCGADIIPLAPVSPLPATSCPPGTPCGFATVVEGITSSDEAANTVFARIDLQPDGSAFTIEDGDLVEIVSVAGMTIIISPRLDDYENLRANGQQNDERSRLVARVVRDQDGNLLLAADVWSHGNSATQAANSGYFAWGISSSQSSLDTLNAGNVSLFYAGTMSVDNRTDAEMRIDFGTNPQWSGNWSNPAWAFSAGGDVTGADLISDPARFSGNVAAATSYVQGALLGEQGSRALAHIIDVELAGHGRIKDVGLLREVSGPNLLPLGGTP